MRALNDLGRQTFKSILYNLEKKIDAKVTPEMNIGNAKPVITKTITNLLSRRNFYDEI